MEAVLCIGGRGNFQTLNYYDLSDKLIMQGRVNTKQFLLEKGGLTPNKIIT